MLIWTSDILSYVCLHDTNDKLSFEVPVDSWNLSLVSSLSSYWRLGREDRGQGVLTESDGERDASDGEERDSVWGLEEGSAEYKAALARRQHTVAL